MKRSKLSHSRQWNRQKKIEGFGEKPQVSNEKRDPGCLGYIGDYTTHLYGDYNKPS